MDPAKAGEGVLYGHVKDWVYRCGLSFVESIGWIAYLTRLYPDCWVSERFRLSGIRVYDCYIWPSILKRIDDLDERYVRCTFKEIKCLGCQVIIAIF
jgi:hypothetical protein